MVPKGVLAAIVCAALLAGSAASAAEGYKPDEFLGLDLSKAALSPKPLGPPAQFEPMRVEPKADVQSKAPDAEPVDADAAPKAIRVAPKAIRVAPKAAKTRIVHARAGKPRAPARTMVARRPSNPLDAQASDTRIQVWPCRSGGICNWRR